MEPKLLRYTLVKIVTRKYLYFATYLAVPRKVKSIVNGLQYKKQRQSNFTTNIAICSYKMVEIQYMSIVSLPSKHSY